MKRRDFCVSALSTLFLSELMSGVAGGLLNQAYASTGSSVKNYITFWMSGGAERCWFDAILTPNGVSDELGAGAGFYTFINDASTNPQYIYKTTEAKVNNKFYLPHLWDSQLPTIDGGSISMKSLATNTAILRGVHTGLSFDAHGQNAEIVQSPFPHVSIMGAIADLDADVFIPAIMNGGKFVSVTHKTPSFIRNDANAHDIFKSLTFEFVKGHPYGSSGYGKLGMAKLDEVVTSFINSIRPQMPSRKERSYQILMDNRKKATSLIQKGFEGISQDYLQAFNNYTALITAVMNPTPDRVLRGLDDKPIYGQGLRFQTWTDLENNYDGYSLIDGFQQSNCVFMAHAFAKAEVYLKHKITNCMQFDIAGVFNIGNKYSGKSNGGNFGFDCHFTGDLYRGLAFSKFYQAFATCLLHFKAQLTSMPGNVWNQTLVNLRSEFARGEAHDRGSDHNITGSAESFFSGAIQDGPIVAGDIAVKNSSLSTGTGALIPEIGNAAIETKHVFSSIGSIMGYTPSRNHASILNLSGGKIVSALGKPRNVKVAG